MCSDAARRCSRCAPWPRACVPGTQLSPGSLRTARHASPWGSAPSPRSTPRPSARGGWRPPCLEGSHPMRSVDAPTRPTRARSCRSWAACSPRPSSSSQSRAAACTAPWAGSSRTCSAPSAGSGPPWPPCSARFPPTRVAPRRGCSTSSSLAAACCRLSLRPRPHASASAGRCRSPCPWPTWRARPCSPRCCAVAATRPLPRRGPRSSLSENELRGWPAI
mmetsp:Transcript_50438/g.118377  ORF Transcript_50438/g.118377 Transcript_50438/m.118377 type:complete len:220 (-) Transcript_50438:31-690(-)